MSSVIRIGSVSKVNYEDGTIEVNIRGSRRFGHG